MSAYPPGGGGGCGGAPPHLQDDRAPPDLDPAIADAILTLVNSHLDENGNFNDPAVLDEIIKLIRNSDPADDIVDKVEKLCSEAETETETERPTIVQGSRFDHAPSDPYPTILAEIRRLNPGVFDEMQAEEASGEVRKLELKAEDDGGGGSEADRGEEVAVETRSDDWGESWKGYENGSTIWEQYDQSGGGGGQNESDDGGGGDVEKAAAESWSWTYQYYPVRPEAEDCSFYLKTGTCKFRSNCKFNHPVERKSNQVAESPGQTECKYYLRPGGCKYGNACRDIHSREKPNVAPVMDTNFAGLPIRPGEKECAYYMRHGECKYASNCRFTHPDPVAEGGSDPSSEYDKGGPALQGASEATWSVPRSLNEPPPYVPVMIPPPPGVPSQTTQWNGYLDHNICTHYSRYGICKFGRACEFDHPRYILHPQLHLVLINNFTPMMPQSA